MVNRFRTPAETREVLGRYRDGRLDILIGTHRLLSMDVQPKDLGLVIVDEEQRFGVAQKEALRQLRLRADVLAMSATPIPRTLQISLSGLRDISVIETPPPGRRPIATHVRRVRRAGGGRGPAPRGRPRGPELLPAQPRRDDRGGRLRSCGRWCPELTIVTAHGQMAEHELEDVMLTFVRGEADVLVATSIIESGLDIPQANTLVVERADRLGLSQLYQIRGRVGRSDVTAHAYLLYPDAATLSRDAASRLRALADYTELGSGLRIAMRDLEIRGAGNLLGDEQSGHVAAIGFELYLEMLNEAVMAGQGARDARAGGAGGDPRLGLHPERLRPARDRQDRPAPAHRPRRGPRRDRRACATRSRTASARCRRRWRPCWPCSGLRVKLRARGGQPDRRALRPRHRGAR